LNDFGLVTDAVGMFGVEHDDFFDLPLRQNLLVLSPSRDERKTVQ